jgi:hypothetical protein
LSLIKIISIVSGFCIKTWSFADFEFAVLKMNVNEQQTTIKAIVYGYKSTPVSIVQRLFKVSYQKALQLYEPLEQAGLIASLPLDEQKQRVINWQHPDWQEIALRRDLWQPWAKSAARPHYTIDDVDDKYGVFQQYNGQDRQLLAWVESLEEGLSWLEEYVEMTETLEQQTRDVLAGKGDFVPRGEQIAFKNHNGQFATMSLNHYLSEKLILTDRANGQTQQFADIEDLLIAGWRLD